MGAADDTPPALPVRRSRYQRTGRHSSPHQLSLPPEAPALVIAVPGSANPASEDVAEAVATTAAASCPGIAIHTGYLRGSRRPIADVLAGLSANEEMPSGVVVPLLTSPHPQADAALAEALADAPALVINGGHMGPHPMLADAVHARLAEAGLARAARAARLSIVSEAEGFVVGAPGGGEALQAAGVVAVLLASRLALPTVPADLGQAASVREAAERLRAAGVNRVALAPCVIGPEVESGLLDTVAAEAGVSCAPPLGGHPAIGRLVAMRYGAALADPKLAGLAR